MAQGPAPEILQRIAQRRRQGQRTRFGGRVYAQAASQAGEPWLKARAPRWSACASRSAARFEHFARSGHFVEVNNYSLVSFAPAPAGTLPRRKTKLERTPEFSWTDISHKEGKRTEDLAKELARRSLELSCFQKGLEVCPDREVIYFPQRAGQDWSQPITHVDGRSTRVQLTGTRTKGWGDKASPFHYQLAPIFRPQRDHDRSWNVALRIYVRCTDLDGKGFEGKEINRRRKTVTKSWWK